MSESGLISTVIPVYNRPAMLAEAVESVLAQTYRPIEIIVVDDGSTDENARAVDALASRHAEVRVIHRDNGGPGAARESGRAAARGELIQYLDSDDLLLPRKFELQVRALQQCADCGIAYSRTRYQDADGREIACTWKPLLTGEATILPHFLRARMWETVAPLYRASVCDAAGPWTALRLEEDWEYDCRVGGLGVKLAFVDEVLAEHRDHADGRLSRGAAIDPARLHDRAAAHALIYAHARRAGIGGEAPEMQHFARELFLLARQCGAAGNSADSRALLRLAAEISPARDLRVYELTTRLIGSTTAGRLALLLDRIRS